MAPWWWDAGRQQSTSHLNLNETQAKFIFLIRCLVPQKRSKASRWRPEQTADNSVCVCVFFNLCFPAQQRYSQVSLYLSFDLSSFAFLRHRFSHQIISPHPLPSVCVWLCGVCVLLACSKHTPRQTIWALNLSSIKTALVASSASTLTVRSFTF